MDVDFVLVSYQEQPQDSGIDLLTAADLACATGLHPELVRQLYGLGLFEAEEAHDGEPRFTANTVFRVRRAVRLHHDLGISWLSLGLVADLLERVEILEARVRTLETVQAQNTVLENAA